ncbi:DALR anticodon-binding domain-containing protein [Crassaminicella indica]|uniref:Arginine--tRNA ligase n=1 Tax=Crassaminicella indica TaxID=2855394 RepID=A0ABX8RCJ5_9CLOT|nr:DALR anticodon-binding domain-containing protein [Crassaminicella indica]QXM06778.1 hypothetical protein KVH43_03385 [Crassaminicella indica]
MEKTIENELKKIIQKILEDIFEYKIPIASIEVEVPKKDEHGDYTTNIALKLSKTFKRNPMDLSCELTKEIENRHDFFEKIEILPPGFINFFLKPKALLDYLDFYLAYKINSNKMLLNNLLQKYSSTQIVELYGLEKIESVQYVHSRACSIIKIFQEEGIAVQQLQKENFHIELNYFEKNIIKKMMNYPKVIKRSITSENIEELIQYMFELSEFFYKFHEKILFRKLDKQHLYVILKIIDHIKIIIKDLLNIFSIDAPEKM